MQSYLDGVEIVCNSHCHSGVKSRLIWSICCWLTSANAPLASRHCQYTYTQPSTLIAVIAHPHRVHQPRMATLTIQDCLFAESQSNTPPTSTPSDMRFRMRSPIGGWSGSGVDAAQCELLAHILCTDWHVYIVRDNCQNQY
eukprot:3512429-Rhodomonas_salina.2